MPLYSVGKVIKEARERLRCLDKKKYSQENLCDGICSVPTLSKIECGLQNPSKKVMEALLQRLGLPIGIYNISATDKELVLYCHKQVKDLFGYDFSAYLTALM